MAVTAPQSRASGYQSAGKQKPQKPNSPAAGPRQPEAAFQQYNSDRKASSPSRRGSDSRKPAADTAGGPNKPEPEILFQKYFKSVGPRTYAAQLKRAGNGNHFLVLTEAKRDDKTNEVRKTRLFVFSEDFVPFFRMLHDTAQFIRQNPVPEEIRKRQERRWSKKPADDRRTPAGRPR